MPKESSCNKTAVTPTPLESTDSLNGVQKSGADRTGVLQRRALWFDRPQATLQDAGLGKPEHKEGHDTGLDSD